MLPLFRQELKTALAQTLARVQIQRLFVQKAINAVPVKLPWSVNRPMPTHLSARAMVHARPVRLTLNAAMLTTALLFVRTASVLYQPQRTVVSLP